MVSRQHKSKPKVKCKSLAVSRRGVEKKKIYKLIEEPKHWICDIQKCKLINKSVLKQPKKYVDEACSSSKIESQMDITHKLDVLENNIDKIAKKERFSETSTCSSNKKLSFSNVSVFYFNRALGQSSVPRDGFHPLGMTMKHVDYEKMKVSLYNSNNVNSKTSTRVTRAKTEAEKHVKKPVDTMSSITSLLTPLPSSSLNSSSLSSKSPSYPSPRSISKIKDGLFQQMCSNSAPRKMFSSSVLSKLRKSPAFSNSLPDCYMESSDKFPWQPQSGASICPPQKPQSRTRSTRSDSKRLARAFSEQLNVQEILETLPKPEKRLLNEISKNCLKSYNDYHKISQMQVDEEEPSSQLPSSSFSVLSSRSSSSKTPLRRSKRKLEESGTRGMKMLSVRDRMTLLRPYGVHPDKSTSEELTQIQMSRQTG